MSTDITHRTCCCHNLEKFLKSFTSGDVTISSFCMLTMQTAVTTFQNNKTPNSGKPTKRGVLCPVLLGFSFLDLSAFEKRV